MFTTKAFRLALIATTLGAFAATADAKPRRLVVLDFDGPRGLADNGRDEVVALLGKEYDVVATKRWEDARSAAQQKGHGPTTWSKAAKSSGVDAVVEGWIQDEGRHHMLTVAIRDASTGNEIDTVQVKLGEKGLSGTSRQKLTEQLDGILEFVEGQPEAYAPFRTVDTRELLGAKEPHGEETARKADKKHAAAADDDAAKTDDAADDDAPAKPAKKKHRKSEELAAADAPAEEPSAADDTDKKTAAKQTDIAALDDRDHQDQKDLVSLLGSTSDEGISIDAKAAHVPKATPRFRIGAGGYYASRSLTFEAENQTGPQNYPGVPHRGLEVNGLVYPFPLKKMDGDLSGIGFSFSVAKSAGSTVTFDDGDSVGEYNINQSSYDLGVHWRQPLGEMLALDSHVNYGRNSYTIDDAPETFEVPDTSYSYMGAGADLDLKIGGRATVGFGFKYLYMLDVGDISSVNFYGPGRASGWGLDGNFLIPLPKDLYVQGTLGYEHVGIDFDGVGQITEDEGVSSSSDSTVAGHVNLGIQW